VQILHALGGQGKSQIALKYCEMAKESHQAIFWINASSETMAREAFGRIASILDHTFSSKVGDLEQKVNYVLETLERWKTRWILVFDNYDSPKGFEVKKCFPRSICLYKKY
jgi:ATP/maltotriose-dependent transcriptional regulator MalT